MTDTITEAPVQPGTKPSTEVVQQVRKNLELVDKGKMTLGEALAQGVNSKPTQGADPVSVAHPTQITTKHRVALGRLPEVFGLVNPDTVRELTSDEIATLAEERGVIDTLLSLLKPRKEEDIREFIANHFDKKAEREGTVYREDVYDTDGVTILHAATLRDDKGHYVVKQDEPVINTDQKFVRETRAGSKPTLSGQALLDAYEAGKINRDQYLACTREVRVYDEDKTRMACKKDPSLLLALGPALVRGSNDTASIRMRP